MSKLFEKIDSDQNGSVSYNETKNWISELDRKKRREIAYDKFGEYDLDGDNIVSLNEYLERLNQERFLTLDIKWSLDYSIKSMLYEQYGMDHHIILLI